MKKIMFFFTILGFQLFCEDAEKKVGDRSSKFVGFFSSETENKLISLFKKFLEKQDKQLEKEQILKNMQALVNLSRGLDEDSPSLVALRKKFFLLLEKI